MIFKQFITISQALYLMVVNDLSAQFKRLVLHFLMLLMHFKVGISNIKLQNELLFMASEFVLFSNLYSFNWQINIYIFNFVSIMIRYLLNDKHSETYFLSLNAFANISHYQPQTISIAWENFICIAPIPCLSFNLLSDINQLMV